MQATNSNLTSRIANAQLSLFPGTRHLTPGTCSSPRFIATLDAGAAAQNGLIRVPLAVTGKWMRGATPG